MVQQWPVQRHRFVDSPLILCSHSRGSRGVALRGSGCATPFAPVNDFWLVGSVRFTPSEIRILGREQARCTFLRSVWTSVTERDKLLKELAVANTTATFQNLALIGALVERHLVDPAKVAGWAEFFAREMEGSAADDPANLQHLRKVAARLRDYARQLANVIKRPETPK
jgi:hypothetical protein